MIKKVTCSVKRGDIEESHHIIHCVVINKKNKILFQSGDINQNHCLRSTLKPFQCAASLETGTDQKYKLSTKEIAVTCASHHAENNHLNTIRAILKKLNLTEDNLECGFHFPLNKENKTKLYSGETQHSNIYNNCSGKHSGLLAMIKNLELNTNGYINHNHPIHQHINTYIEKQAGIKSKHFAIDGCSLPTPYFNLFTLAKMYMKLITSPKDSPLFKVFNAMTAFPEMVSGTKGFDTHFMRSFKGQAISKGGAEGMQALAMQNKKGDPISLALKVADGNHRGNYVSCIKILEHINIINSNEANGMLDFIKTDQYNLNKLKTGELVCNILD